MHNTHSEHEQVGALIKLLLNNKPIVPGLAFLGGEPLTLHRRIQLGQASVDGDTDLIYVSFKVDERGGSVISDITIFAPRDNGCHIYPGCRLSQRRGAKNLVIIPPDHVRGHFEIAPGEIIHRQSKPKELVEGGDLRAARRFRQLLKSGQSLSGQAKLFDMSAVA